MQPSRLTEEEMESYLSSGDWTRDTIVESYAEHARKYPSKVACRDEAESFDWKRIEGISDCVAANLIALGLQRDDRVLIQMPSSCKELILRVALKKAGLIGTYAPMQWRRQELKYVLDKLAPSLAIMPRGFKDFDGAARLREAEGGASSIRHRICIEDDGADGWLGWGEIAARPADPVCLDQIPGRRFSFDDVSLITASSGTSGLAKLCEWPEAAQVCIGRGIGERMAITAEDRIGVFSPMSGAPGVLLWTVSAATPCEYVFPASYDAAALLELIQKLSITLVTTVPVILARLVQEPLEKYDLSSLRALRVGTAAMDIRGAIDFEDRTGCQVIPASGSMECPGFGHAGVNEPKSLRLDGSVGRPLRGCHLRILDVEGQPLPAGAVGEVRVKAPFAASGYWKDVDLTKAAWKDGWYATGDIGCLDETGRLTLLGRSKEVINRSGHKILPIELEREIAQHPDIFECAVIAAPDPEYGEVPWAFVQPRRGTSFDAGSVIEMLRRNGLASYKIPARILQISEFPRISGNKIDKKVLLERSGSPSISTPNRK